MGLSSSPGFSTAVDAPALTRREMSAGTAATGIGLALPELSSGGDAMGKKAPEGQKLHPLIEEWFEKNRKRFQKAMDDLGHKRFPFREQAEKSLGSVITTEANPVMGKLRELVPKPDKEQEQRMGRLLELEKKHPTILPVEGGPALEIIEALRMHSGYPFEVKIDGATRKKLDGKIIQLPTAQRHFFGILEILSRDAGLGWKLHATHVEISPRKDKHVPRVLATSGKTALLSNADNPEELLLIGEPHQRFVAVERAAMVQGPDDRAFAVNAVSPLLVPKDNIQWHYSIDLQLRKLMNKPGSASEHAWVNVDALMAEDPRSVTVEMEKSEHMGFQAVTAHRCGENTVSITQWLSPELTWPSTPYAKDTRDVLAGNGAKITLLDNKGKSVNAECVKTSVHERQLTTTFRIPKGANVEKVTVSSYSSVDVRRQLDYTFKAPAKVMKKEKP